MDDSNKNQNSQNHIYQGLPNLNIINNNSKIGNSDKYQFPKSQDLNYIFDELKVMELSTTKEINEGKINSHEEIPCNKKQKFDNIQNLIMKSKDLQMKKKKEYFNNHIKIQQVKLEKEDTKNHYYLKQPNINESRKNQYKEIKDTECDKINKRNIFVI